MTNPSRAREVSELEFALRTAANERYAKSQDGEVDAVMTSLISANPEKFRRVGNRGPWNESKVSRDSDGKFGSGGGGGTKKKSPDKPEPKKPETKEAESKPAAGKDESDDESSPPKSEAKWIDAGRLKEISQRLSEDLNTVLESATGGYDPAVVATAAISLHAIIGGMTEGKPPVDTAPSFGELSEVMSATASMSGAAWAGAAPLLSGAVSAIANLSIDEKLFGGMKRLGNATAEEMRRAGGMIDKMFVRPLSPTPARYTRQKEVTAETLAERFAEADNPEWFGALVVALSPVANNLEDAMLVADILSREYSAPDKETYALAVAFAERYAFEEGKISRGQPENSGQFGPGGGGEDGEDAGAGEEEPQPEVAPATPAGPSPETTAMMEKVDALPDSVGSDMMNEVREQHGEQNDELKGELIGAIMSQDTTPPPPGDWLQPDLGGGKESRIGIPADMNPPPPKIPQLPHLNAEEREVETEAREAFEKDPEGMTAKYIDDVLANALRDGTPPTFETDEAKMQFGSYSGAGLEDNAEVLGNRAKYSTPLHPTAHALNKKAFITYLDRLKSEGKEVNAVITSGGVASGKGYCTTNPNAAPESVRNLVGQASCVFDAAGEQNGTDNPWIAEELDKRGQHGTFIYVHSDPKVAFPRAIGRSVTKGRHPPIHLAVESFEYGHKNSSEFLPTLSNHDVIYLDARGNKPQIVPSMPKDDGVDDVNSLVDQFSDTIQGWEQSDANKKNLKVPNSVIESALNGYRYFQGAKGKQAKSADTPQEKSTEDKPLKQTPFGDGKGFDESNNAPSWDEGFKDQKKPADEPLKQTPFGDGKGFENDNAPSWDEGFNTPQKGYKSLTDGPVSEWPDTPPSEEPEPKPEPWLEDVRAKLRGLMMKGK